MGDEKAHEVYFYGQKQEKPCPLISTMKGSKLMCQACMDVLVSCC